MIKVFIISVCILGFLVALRLATMPPEAKPETPSTIWYA